MDVKSKIASIILKIRHYDKMYHGQDISEISDFEYDSLKLELSNLYEKFPNEFPDQKMPDDVGFLLKSKFEKITHDYPMLSLDNAFCHDDLSNFFKRILKHTDDTAVMAEPKIDGLSCAIRYENGKYQMGLTRGNGTTGENVSMQIATITNVPKTIPYKDKIEIRGEVYIEKKEFESINKKRMENDQKLFKTARNTAAGTVRQLDINIVKSRNLKFFAYEIKPNIYETESEKFKLLSNLGFTIFDDFTVCKNADECEKFYQMITKKRDDLPFEIDGIVYKLHSIKGQEKIGKSQRSPKYSIAYKFPAKEATAKIEDVIFTMGKTGILTPVAKISPTEIDGVLLSNISIHNISELQKKDIQINDTVKIKRAGDVIPYITEVVMEKRDKSATKIIIPKTCYSCNMPVTIVNDTFIVCQNHTKCKEQLKQQIIFLVSKECFNIEGMGKSTIDLFLEKEIIKDASDIFTLSAKKEMILNEHGWSDISYNKLINEIENKKNITLDRFLNAIGIKHMGKTMSKNIASFFKTFENFKNATENIDNLKCTNGISDKTAIDIIDSFNQNREKAEKILKHITILENQNDSKIDKNHIFYNKSIVITGSFDNMDRDQIAKKIENLGGIIKTSVSKKTDFLIVGHNPGSKLSKASNFNTKIISQTELLPII